VAEQSSNPLCRPEYQARIQEFTSRFAAGQPLDAHQLVVEELPYADAGSWRTRSLATMWFEHTRAEYHPEHASSPYEVMLGRLGAELVAKLNGGDEHLRRDRRIALQASYASFNLFECETNESRYVTDFAAPPARIDEPFGFRIYDRFLDTWRLQGVRMPSEASRRGAAPFTYTENLMRWGHPMSPFCRPSNVCAPGVPHDQIVGVQFFERARLDLMRDGSVQVAPLGTQLYNLQSYVTNRTPCGGAPVATPTPLPTPVPTPPVQPPPAEPPAPPTTPTTVEGICAALEDANSETWLINGVNIPVACVRGQLIQALSANQALFSHEVVQTHAGTHWMDAMPQGMLFTVRSTGAADLVSLQKDDRALLLVTRLGDGTLEIVRLQKQ
jgi:hypothetical protein